MLQVKSDSFDDGHVDRDVPVLLDLTSILSLLLQDSEPILKGKIIIDQVGESSLNQVAHTKTKVDTYDKEHVVPPSLILHKIVRDDQDVLHALYRL